MGIAAQQKTTMSGHKQTEVGVIPEDWNLHELEALASVIDGDRGAQYPSANEFSDTGYCLFLNAGNVTNDGFKFVDCAFITQRKDALLNKGKLKRDDIVLTTRGTVGNFAHYDTGVLFDDIRINSGMVILRNESPLLDTAFLYALLKSHLVRTQIERFAFGSAQPQLTVKGICKFKVLVPPLPEQRAIADALADVDALIASLDALIAKKRDLKQAAMQQLLTGRQRLPGFSGEWAVKRLGEIGSTFGGLTGKTKSDFGDGAARYITFMNIMTHVVIDPNAFEHVKVSPSESQNRVMRGDLFFNGSSETPEEVGMCAVLLEDAENVFLNSFCFGFRLREGAETDGLYLAYYFRSSEGRKLLFALAQGPIRYNLSKTILMKLKFPLPSFTEQTAIAAVLSDMDAEIAALEERREKTHALKQGMMQELLTGKTRLI